MIDRQNKLAMIHIARKQLALTDDQYRALLYGAAGFDSCRDLETEKQYRDIMAAFRNAGYRQSPRKGRKITDPQMAKCYALWCELYRLGAVAHKEYRAFVSWCDRRLGGHQDILRGDQKSLLIEELKAWIDRVGREE